MIQAAKLLTELNAARQALRDHLAAERLTRHYEDDLVQRCLAKANERTRYWQERAEAAEKQVQDMIVQK